MEGKFFQTLVAQSWHKRSSGPQEEHREFRELIIPFGHGGCVVLLATREAGVVLLAARDKHDHDFR
jgi:hypothetical protein